jgi:hypothetical protein
LHTNNTLSHLFYTNTKTTTHNEKIFEKTVGETFKFVAQDMHSSICPFHFELSMLPIQTSGCHYDLLFIKHCGRIMGWKLCNIRRSCKWRKWQLSLLYSSICSKPLIWINFYNPQIGINMRIQHPRTYKDFPTFKKK